MAKDPAFLFYTGDFSTGTQFFSDEQVGKYIRLLMAQHQLGHLQEKHMIMICKSYDKDIFDKFKKDEAGLFFNERLEEEIMKRKKFSESRSNNKKGKTKPLKAEKKEKSYDNHMENKDENKIVSKNKKVTVYPELFEFENYFIENGFPVELAQRAFKGYTEADWHDTQGKKILNWKQKCQNVWFRDENKKEKGSGEKEKSKVEQNTEHVMRNMRWTK